MVNDGGRLKATFERKVKEGFNPIDLDAKTKLILATSRSTVLDHHDWHSTTEVNLPLAFALESILWLIRSQWSSAQERFK